MFRNKLIELANFVAQPTLIGAKLRDYLLIDENSPVLEDGKYSNARQMITQIQKANLQLQEAKRKYLKATKPEKQKEISEIISKQISSTNEVMQKLVPLLEQINTQFKNQSEGGDKSKLVDCNRIKQDASQAITQFRNVQEDIAAQMKDTIHRQAKIIQNDISQGELQNLVNHPERGQQMLREKLLDSPSVQLENSVSDIIDKCNDVLKLEKSMRQCLSMMEELALLVQYQGQKLITIEEAIDGAKNHVQKGDIKLESGKQLHKKSQKKMCCIMMGLLAIIGVIVIPIVITQIK